MPQNTIKTENASLDFKINENTGLLPERIENVL